MPDRGEQGHGVQALVQETGCLLEPTTQHPAGIVRFALGDEQLAHRDAVVQRTMLVSSREEGAGTVQLAGADGLACLLAADVVQKT